MPGPTDSSPDLTTAAIVTGGAGAIGTAEAELLIAAGHHVVLNDVDADRLAQTVLTLGGAAVATAVAGDIADATTAEELVRVATDGRRLAVVVNNAGITTDGMVFNLTDEAWDAVIAVNLRGTFLLTRAAARHWRAESKRRGGPVDGVLVNTTSRAALLANPGQTNYAAAKAGIAVMTQIVARELRAYGVRANAIAPRAFTPMMQAAFGDFREEELEAWSPRHIARFVGHLASEAGRGISGQVFVVRGTEVSLVAPWDVLPSVDVDFDAQPSRVEQAMAQVFAGRDTEIAAFQIGEDLPRAGATA